MRERGREWLNDDTIPRRTWRPCHEFWVGRLLIGHSQGQAVTQVGWPWDLKPTTGNACSQGLHPNLLTRGGVGWPHIPFCGGYSLISKVDGWSKDMTTICVFLVSYLILSSHSLWSHSHLGEMVQESGSWATVGDGILFRNDGFIRSTSDKGVPT